jgi:hypothetical protein
MDEFNDDPSIEDAAHLWRRIPPLHVIYDNNLNRYRPTSDAFKDHPNGSPMSVFLAAVISRTGRTAEDALVGHEGYALSSFTAGLARHLEQGVARDPLPEEPAHAVVFGRKSKSIRQKLSKQCTWVVPPPAGAI